MAKAWGILGRRGAPSALGGAVRILASPESARLGVVAGAGLSPVDSHSCWIPTDEQWRAFAEEVRRQHAWGIVAAADGSRIKVPARYRPLVEAEHRVEMAKALVLERATVQVERALRDDGVAVRVLKGPASAHLIYGDISLRCFNDVDLLVPGEELDRSVRIVERLGGVRHRGERVPGATAQVGKGVGLTLPNGVEVDLHRRLSQGTHQFGVSERILFENPERFFLGGQGLEALSRPVAFIHACLHAVLAGDSRRILPLRDVAQHLVGTLAVDEVEDAARGLRAIGPTAAAVIAAVQLLALDLPGHPLVEWARRQKVSRSDQMWLEIAARDGRLSRPALAMAGLVSQPDLRHAARYTRIQASRRMPRQGGSLRMKRAHG